MAVKQKRKNIFKIIFIFFIVAIVSNILSLLTLGRENINVGPVNFDLIMSPALSGVSKIDLGPVGSLEYNSHKGPIAVTMKINSMSPKNIQDLILNKSKLNKLKKDTPHKLLEKILYLIFKIIIGGFIISLIMAYTHFKDLKLTFYAGILTIFISSITGMVAYATYNTNKIMSPTYHGLIEIAPSMIGRTKDIAENIDKYHQELKNIYISASKLYTLTSLSINNSKELDNTVKILHISDLHLNPEGLSFAKYIAESYKVDIIVDTGDIADHGYPVENAYIKGVESLPVKYIYVKGNHDSKESIRYISTLKNVVNLSDFNNNYVYKGITFKGIGDPEYTPDKLSPTIPGIVKSLYQKINDKPEFNGDILLLHDPLDSDIFTGKFNTILAGHLHNNIIKKYSPQTLLQISGSTGAGGLRMESGGKSEKYEASVLYYDRKSKKVISIDEITMDGLGSSSVTVKRVSL